MEQKSKYEDEILRSLRRITRAIDLHSRQLANQYKLTGPQLVCLRILEDQGPLTPSALAKEMSLSQGTVTGIVDRLVSRELVSRTPSTNDRRSLNLTITPTGLETVSKAPSPLQEHFAKRLRTIPQENQQVIHTILEQIVRMMGADEVEAAPVLASGATTVPAKAVEKFLEQEEKKIVSETPSPSERPSLSPTTKEVS